MDYPGLELENFDKAVIWRKYIYFLLKKYIKKNVLEVGAGIGSFTRNYEEEINKITISESDEKNFNLLLKKFSDKKNITVVKSFIKEIDDDFNTILYLNVLEHIENPKEVFQKNILIREAICKNLMLRCFTFLQPFPSIHGFYDNKLFKERAFNQLDLDKYNLLKNTKHIFDISNSLDGNMLHSFVDNNHYSPGSNKLIAKSIYDIANKKIDEYR